MGRFISRIIGSIHTCIYPHGTRPNEKKQKEKRNRGRGGRGRSDNTNEIGWYIAVIFRRNWSIYSASRYVIKHPATSSLDTKSFLSFFFFLPPPPSPLLFFRTVKFRGSRSTRIGPNKQPSRRPSLVSWWIFHVEYVPSCLIRYESLVFQLFFFSPPFFFSSTVQLCRIISQIATILDRNIFFLMPKYCLWITRKD